MSKRVNNCGTKRKIAPAKKFLGGKLRGVGHTKRLTRGARGDRGFSRFVADKEGIPFPHLHLLRHKGGVTKSWYRIVGPRGPEGWYYPKAV
jgi:hypothetical protein